MGNIMKSHYTPVTMAMIHKSKPINTHKDVVKIHLNTLLIRMQTIATTIEEISFLRNLKILPPLILPTDS